MSSKEIYILGVGNNTIVYIDLVEACGYSVAGLYHYNNERVGERIHGFPIIDSNTNLFKNDSLKGRNFVISVGDNKIRLQIANEIRKRGGVIPALFHPSAIVSRYAIIEEGVVIHANSVVQADAQICHDSVISYNVSITHTSKIGQACYIAAGANIGAYVNIDDFVLVGQSACIISGKVKVIGNNSIIGAGAVVINDVDNNTVVAGNPAKVIKTRT